MTFKNLLKGGIALGAAIALFSSSLAFADHGGLDSNLTIGSRGGDVVTLQTWLETEGFLVMPAGVSKGYFGPITRNALANYQAANNIRPSVGFFGPLTRAHIDLEIALAEQEMDDDMEMMPTTMTPAADLRVTLNSLLREHVNLGMIALYNVIDNDDATAASVEALDENTNELAAVVGSVYGKDAQEGFDTIWTDHIGFFANYATGLRTNDEDLRDDAEEDLEQYQQDIATFFNSALPEIKKSTVIAGSGEHKDLLIEAMDEYHAGDYEGAYEAQRKADKQIAGIANLLSENIVKQNPDLFR